MDYIRKIEIRLEKGEEVRLGRLEHAALVLKTGLRAGGLPLPLYIRDEKGVLVVHWPLAVWNTRDDWSRAKAFCASVWGLFYEHAVRHSDNWRPIACEDYSPWSQPYRIETD